VLVKQLLNSGHMAAATSHSIAGLQEAVDFSGGSFLPLAFGLAHLHISASWISTVRHRLVCKSIPG